MNERLKKIPEYKNPTPQSGDIVLVKSALKSPDVVVDCGTVIIVDKNDKVEFKGWRGIRILNLKEVAQGRDEKGHFRFQIYPGRD